MDVYVSVCVFLVLYRVCACDVSDSENCSKATANRSLTIFLIIFHAQPHPFLVYHPPRVACGVWTLGGG